nr:uncharacterized protein LOC123842642 isoform X1 [Mirounga angustirostris]
MSLSCLPLGPFTTMISGREGLGLGETTVPPCLPERGFFVLVTWARNVSLTLLHHPLFRLLPGKELPKVVFILGLVSSFIVLGILLIIAAFFVMYRYKKKGKLGSGQTWRASSESPSGAPKWTPWVGGPPGGFCCESTAVLIFSFSCLSSELFACSPHTGLKTRISGQLAGGVVSGVLWAMGQGETGAASAWGRPEGGRELGAAEPRGRSPPVLLAGVWPHHWFFSFLKGRLDGPDSAVSIVLRFP